MMMALEMEDEEMETFLSDHESSYSYQNSTSTSNRTHSNSNTPPRRFSQFTRKNQNHRSSTADRNTQRRQLQLIRQRRSRQLSVVVVFGVVVAIILVGGKKLSFFNNSNHSDRNNSISDDSGANVEGVSSSNSATPVSSHSTSAPAIAPRSSKAPTAAPAIIIHADPVASSSSDDTANQGPPSQPSSSQIPTPPSPPPRISMRYSDVSSFPPDLEESSNTSDSSNGNDNHFNQAYQWTFYDGDEDDRPNHKYDYCGAFPPHRDIPAYAFPENAWQTDAVYVNHLLDAADRFVRHVKYAMYAEYGYSDSSTSATSLLEARHAFQWQHVKDHDLFQQHHHGEEEDDSAEEDNIAALMKDVVHDQISGWMSVRAQNGLARRLLHALQTNDAFTMAIVGDGTGAGHEGNHFHQSYGMQLHRVLRPVLARLGVKLVTRNLSRRSSSSSTSASLEAALGMRTLIGDDVDVIVWDFHDDHDDHESSNAQLQSKSILDLFLRQAMLAGTSKIPLLWVSGGAARNSRKRQSSTEPEATATATDTLDVLRYLHNAVDADVGVFGTGLNAITDVTTPESFSESFSNRNSSSIPFAAQFVKCNSTRSDRSNTTKKVNEQNDDDKEEEDDDFCQQHNPFCAVCWIDRDDIDPAIAFDVKLAASPTPWPSHQQEWVTKGWREHLLTSRVLLSALLDGLQMALQIFSDETRGGPPLDDEFWHMTEYYANVRTKLVALDPEAGACPQIKELGLPSRMCQVALHGRGLHTPRYNPDESSLVSLIRATPDGYKPVNEQALAYEGPDVHNSCYDIPSGNVNVVAIVNHPHRRRRRRRRRHLELVAYNETSLGVTYPYISSVLNNTKVNQRRKLENGNEIVPGKGWEVILEKPGVCNGEYRSICGRERSNNCPLAGHHDSPGVLVGNEYSGWLVLDLPDVNEGIILLRLNTALQASDSKRTEGWTSVNNERRRTWQVDSKQGKTNTSIESNLREVGYFVFSRHLQDDNVPEDLIFEFAINGEIHSWNREEFLAKRSRPQQAMELWTLLDDPMFPKGQVELAIRLRDCGNRCTFGIPHVYWA